MFKKVEKGNYGYINNNKIRQLAITFILLVIVLIIYFTGVIRYGHTKSIFTVLAAVSAIPAAKYAVAYIVSIQYKTGDKDKYDKVAKLNNVNIYSDLLISSPEKIINVEIAAVRDNSVICYIPHKKAEKAFSEKYIRTFLEKECKVSAVKAFKEFDKFEKAVKELNNNVEGRFDKRIGELLKIYSM